MRVKSWLAVFAALVSISGSAWGLTDQIDSGESWLAATQKPSGETLVSSAYAPANGISYSRRMKKSEWVSAYQKEFGLQDTGILDRQTRRFVMRKQRELGLSATGNLDLATWYASYPQSDGWQRQSIETALGQWRSVMAAVAASGKSKFAVVDVPSMTVRAYDYDAATGKADLVVESRAVVGKRKTQTPLRPFSIWGIEYHPIWIPTSNILKHDLYRHGELNERWIGKEGLVGEEANGEDVALNDETIGSVKRILQPAGEKNALGILKFQTDSADDVYLHDTNQRYLFDRNFRAYSHGCVRVKDFMGLAAWASGLDEDELGKKLDDGKTRTEGLRDGKIPVFFTYSPVYFENGKPRFAPDPYRVGYSPEISYDLPKRIAKVRKVNTTTERIPSL